MTSAPFHAASPVIQLHIVAMLLAVVLTPGQFLLRQGTVLHKICGYVWMAAMLVAALSSFAITAKGSFSLWGYSPIHLLSVFVTINVPLAILAARKRRISAHRRIVRGLSIGAILLAGLFTLVPGRIMHQIVFGL